MKKYLNKNKFAFSIFSLLLALYLWGAFSSFRLFRSEYGHSYKAGTHNGSIHHK